MSALTQAMTEYGQAVRGDWSNFDGRSERAVIESWVREIETPDPAHDIEWWREELGICMTGGGHWCWPVSHCDADCECPCGVES